MSVPISTIPRIEPIWLHGGGSFSADHALGVGENGIGDGLVGFRLLQERLRLLEVSFRLLQERLPNCPFIKAPIDVSPFPLGPRSRGGTWHRRKLQARGKQLQTPAQRSARLFWLTRNGSPAEDEATHSFKVQVWSQVQQSCARAKALKLRNDPGLFLDWF